MNNPSSLVCRAPHSCIPVPFYVTPTSAICPLPLLGRLRKQYLSQCTAQPCSAQDSEARRTRTYHTCLGRVPRLAGNHGGWGSISAPLQHRDCVCDPGLPLGLSASRTLAFALAPAVYTPWVSNSR